MRIVLDKIEKYSRKSRMFKPYSNYPMVLRDLSIEVASEVKEGEIESVISSSIPGSLLKNLILFDRYEFDKKVSDKISYTYALSFQADDKTLSGDEINGVMEKVIKNLSKKLNAELRK